MASAIDLSGLTLNPEEALSTSEAIFEKTYVEESDISKTSMVMTGIQMKKQIPFFGRMGLVGKASSSCDTNAATGVSTSQKYWDPVLFDWRLTHCQGDISQLFKMWKRSSNALDTWEGAPSEQIAFLADRSMNAGMEAILRLSSFGDKQASPVGDATGDELLTVGTDKTYFNLFDGFWPQAIDAVTAGDTNRYEITENSEATKDLQLVLASDRAIKVLRGLYNNADSRLLASGDMVFAMTRSLFNNWQDYLEDKSLVFTLDQTEKGSTKFSYRGIPIEVRDDWDRNIAAYYDNGTTLNLPHRAWLSTKGNMPIGTSDEGNFSSFDAFYDKTDKKHYIDQAMYLDAKLLEEYMISVAY